MDNSETILTPELSADAAHRASMRRLGEIDWDFPTRPSESAFSSLHWHPCRFPSQIPAITIARLTRPGDLVLDPFMGSATTLVEAQRLGRRAIGVDLNPVSCLIARSKTLAASEIDIARYVGALKARVVTGWDRIQPAPLPPLVQGEKWYTPSTLLTLLKIWSAVDQEDGALEDIGRSAFSAILLPACRETRHWGYVCDNTNPKSQREVDTKNLFLTALDRFVRAYLERDRGVEGPYADVEIIEGDATSSLAHIEDATCSALVTSPPYYGVADYVKAQRLSMEWFSYPIEPLRRVEIGARSKRHRRNSADSYIDELEAVFKQCHRLLKTGAPGIIVFGQSPSREDCEVKFVETLQMIGFKIELERQRQIPPTRRLTPSLVVETVLVVRK